MSLSIPQLIRSSSGQKRLDKKLDNFVDILQTYIKEQKKNFVTIDLNSLTFVIDPNASFQVPLVTCVTSVAADIVPKTRVTDFKKHQSKITTKRKPSTQKYQSRQQLCVNVCCKRDGEMRRTCPLGFPRPSNLRKCKNSRVHVNSMLSPRT